MLINQAKKSVSNITSIRFVNKYIYIVVEYSFNGLKTTKNRIVLVNVLSEQKWRAYHILIRRIGHTPLSIYHRVLAKESRAENNGQVRRGH